MLTALKLCMDAAAHLSAREAHCLLKATSLRHSAGVFVAKRSMSLSATASWDCLRVSMGSETLASDVEAAALLLALSAACWAAAEAATCALPSLSVLMKALLAVFVAIVRFRGKPPHDEDTSHALLSLGSCRVLLLFACIRRREL